MDNSKIEKKMAKEQKTLEVKRQIFHVIAGSMLVLFLYFEILPLWLFFIINITGTVIYFTWNKNASRIFSWFFYHFERKHGKKGHGALLYVWGCFFTIVFFQQNIAYAAMLMLALGDSVSHYVGLFYGKIQHPLNKRKNVEGTIAGIMAAFAGGVVFVPAVTAFGAAFVVMSAEAIEWKIGKYKIDDNFWIPIASAVVITGMQLV